MCASSSRHSRRFCSCTRLHVDLVLAPRDRPPQPLLDVRHKTQRQLLGDQPFHQPFGIRKILLPAARALDSTAPAPDAAPRHAGRRLGAAAARGCQCRSSASHTGRQYCAVDSITTSSTSRSTSQSASARNCSGLVPTCRRSNSLLALDFDVRDHHRQHLLVHIDSRDPVRHTASPGGSGERAHVVLLRVTGYRRSTRGPTTPTYSLKHARSGSANSPASTCSTGSIDLAARAGAILATRATIFIRFRELMSARGHALLQLFLPVQDDLDLRSSMSVPDSVCPAGIRPTNLPPGVMS